MITVNGKELAWKDGLTIQDLATAIGGAPGTSFVSVEAPPASVKTLLASVETLFVSRGAPRPHLVSRLEWPDTRVQDGVTISFIVIPSGG